MPESLLTNLLVVGTLVTLCAVLPCCAVVSSTPETPARRCLVLADGYVSEYAWGKYAEAAYPSHHPGHYFAVKGLLDWPNRFERWLDDWRVERIDLETLAGPLDLAGFDLVILDDVRQSVCDPHEHTLVEFVRQGGGLIVYAGRWSLGGRAKDEFSVPTAVDTYLNCPLAAILPVTIEQAPDLVACDATAVFADGGLGQGIETEGWRVFAMHDCAPRGDVWATLDGKPFIAAVEVGAGRSIVYNADDLAWIQRNSYTYNMSGYAGTLWRRLAARAVGEAAAIPAQPDTLPPLVKPAALAHPDKPMNFLWQGYTYYRGPEMLHYVTADLLGHSATLMQSMQPSRPEIGEAIGRQGILSWANFGCPIATPAAREDPAAARIEADGQRATAVGRHPAACYNNPVALQYMEEAMARRAAEFVDQPWIAYGHMGDETEFGNCFCEHCQAAFREQFGYELPRITDDFSPENLNRWIDYSVFKNRSIGAMYARARAAARRANPRLRMFASLPHGIGITHGYDLVHTQAGFDILWEHTYPGTMVSRVGMVSELYEDAAVIQGRPYVPIWNLLQGFDSYDRAPYVPPAEYVRGMTWQAVAHGIDSVGWFVYNAFWWVLPGTDAWAEAGRLAEEMLEPYTPAFYGLRNADEPVALMWCYSQEAVDGLKELTWSDDEPWKGIVRWWTTHATQEAYEVLKYAHVPLNVINEYRLWREDLPRPWRAIVIPYVEHLHPQTQTALREFMDAGGKVYVGANSTFAMSGLERLPMAFDLKVNTWWPAERRDQWNQRRVRQYLIGPMLEKARHLPAELLALRTSGGVTVDDPQVLYNVRTGGAAQYIFLMNDHQVNPTTPELRRERQRFNHFMLMPMEFPATETTARFAGDGVLYQLYGDDLSEPYRGRGELETPLRFEGGAGKLFMRLPEPITAVRLTAAPTRSEEGVRVQAQVRSARGVIDAVLPLRIDIVSGAVQQTVYAATQQGQLDWTAPWLRDFPAGPVTVTVTDLAAGRSASAATE